MRRQSLPIKPEAIVATGASHLNNMEDVAYITAYFADNLIAHLNVNWLSLVKVRTTLLGGEKRMLVWNDLESDEKIKIYDKGGRDKKRRECLRSVGQLPFGGYVVTAAGTEGSSGPGMPLFCGLCGRQSDPVQ